MSDKFIFTSGEKYIAMDDVSGGYPYETDDFLQVKAWPSLDKALSYKEHFPEKDWQVRRLHGLNMSLPLDIRNKKGLDH